jgi:DoxX-like family
MRTDTSSRKTRALLWVIQALLAALFLFAGGMKLLTPVAALAKMSPLPPLFIKFIGLAEAAGALGLILPGLLRIKIGLTPLAAAGLVIIMGGATVVTAAGGQIAPAAFPFVVGALATFVALKRWRSLATQAA